MVRPLTLTVPMLLPPPSVNQRFPSGPTVIQVARLLAVGMEYSVMTPVVVILPILSVPYSVNHMAPSGPATIP